LLARNPTLILAPLIMAVAQVLLSLVIPGGSGFFGAVNNSLAQFIGTLLAGFGLSVALIQADTAWRRGRAPFDAAWEEARRKLPDILMAVIGLNFMLFVAFYVGGIIPIFGSIALGVIALFFFIYTLPAAAIGGVPGGAALQVALERAKAGPLPTAVVTIACGFTYVFLPNFVSGYLIELLAGLGVYSSTVTQLIVALGEAIAAGYIALILSKAYNDISYRGY
jgi:succinate dehydrogenase/fumarate reductase cytochrome b subunit